MTFVDTHSHIYLPQFDVDRDDSIRRAAEKGVKKMILPNIDSGSIASMNKVVKQYPDICFPLMGLHPTSVKENFEDELNIILNELNTDRYIGIGEIGIDLYWDKTYISEQEEVFEKQVRLALSKDLPFVIHARESYNEIMNVLKKINAPMFKGIFHAFSANIEEAKTAIEMGFYIGIGGVLTFKNAHLAEVVKNISLESIVLETDSPYLAPVPHRGKRNESSYIPLIAKRMAELKEVTVKEVSQTTTSNTSQIFGIEM